jgi:cytochrome b subunit of formate dehydrogenase
LKELIRFSTAQRSAHFLASIAGLTLLITGLPITFSDQLRWVIDAMGGPVVSMLVHRIAGVILAFTLAYFGTYFVVERLTRGRGDSNITFTNPKFFLTIPTDMIVDMLWTFNLAKERPKSGKYDWIMVADILTVPTFCLVEVITGALLWFPFPVLSFNPGLVLLIRTVHVWVAVFAIFFVFAHATILHWTPGNYPINMGIFNGLIQKHKAEGEFPEWIPVATEVETDAKPYKFHPIGYVVGTISCGLMLLAAYSVYLLANEGLAGFRLLQESPIAFVGLNGVIGILSVYVLFSLYGLSKAISES